MSSGEFDHLKDWIDVKEETKETLKHGLLAFLHFTEKQQKETLDDERLR